MQLWGTICKLACEQNLSVIYQLQIQPLYCTHVTRLELSKINASSVQSSLLILIINNACFDNCMYSYVVLIVYFYNSHYSHWQKSKAFKVIMIRIIASMNKCYQIIISTWRVSILGCFSFSSQVLFTSLTGCDALTRRLYNAQQFVDSMTILFLIM